MPVETIHLSSTADPQDVGKSGGGGGKAKEAFQPTAGELKSIQEKMKDPVFVELMHEYMQSLQDPETRREEEAYLEQAEREAREGGDFSFEFIFPRPAFAVELSNPTTRRISVAEARKVIGAAAATSSSSSSSSSLVTKDAPSFINVCSSDKVEVYTEERAGGGGAGQASNWHVPVAVSAKRIEVLPDGVVSHHQPSCKSPANGSSSPSAPQLCFVYDAVYNPKTLSLAERSDRFLCFLVEVAVENINAGYGESNGFEFHRLPSAVSAVGMPKNQTIRKKGSGGNPLSGAVDPVLTKPTKHLYSREEEKKAAAPPRPHSSSTSTAKTEAAQEKSGSTDSLPPHTIAHRGTIDISDAWQWKVSERRVGIPEELVVKLTFPGVKKASALDIDITDDGSAVRVATTPEQQQYSGLLVLPFTVETTPRKAALDRSTGALTLVLKVVPPVPTEAERAVAAEVKDRFIGRAIEPLAASAAPKAETGANAETEESKPAEAPVTKEGKEPVQKEAASAKEAEPTKAVEGTATATTTTAAAAPLPPPASASDFTNSADRAQQMMMKVMEARKAREAAAAAASADTAEGTQEEKTAELSAEKDETEKVDSPPPSTQEREGHETEEETEKEEEEAMPFIQKRDTAREAEEAELRSRQEAWAVMVQEQMAQMTAKEDAEAAEAVRLAEVEKAKAAKRLAALKEAEARETQAKAKMATVPLGNKYIFSID